MTTVTLGNVEVTREQLEAKLKELELKEFAERNRLHVGRWFRSHYTKHIHVVTEQLPGGVVKTMEFTTDGVWLEKDRIWNDGLSDYTLLSNPFSLDIAVRHS